MTVTFQGEIGAFSEEAALSLFPDASLLPLPSFDSVFSTVESGGAAFGVVPIENSLHGSVHTNYDLLREHGVRIVAEVQLRIKHHLMANPGVALADVRRVHSHPQALGQCRDFLRHTLPGVEAVPAYDTAGAAKRLAEEARPDEAAIASERAAVEYGLDILAAGIESDQGNYTRFLAIESDQAGDRGPKRPAIPGEATVWKTSVLYVPRENIPGVLFKSLGVFALRDIDLYKIESRPLVGSPGQYIFYLDLAGSRGDEPVRNALDHLGEIAAFVKVLGSYPRGNTIG